MDSQFFIQHVDITAQASSANRSAEAVIPAPQFVIKTEYDDIGRAPAFEDRAVELFQCGQQTVETDGGSYAGQLFLGVEGSQVVVAAATAYRSEIGEIGKEGFVNDSGIVVQSPGYGRIVDEVLFDMCSGEVFVNLFHPLRVLGFMPAQV